jgi:hypothetical protein
MEYLFALIPLLIILSTNLGLVLLTKRKFGTTMPLTVIFISMLMFVSQAIFQTFYVAYIATIACSAASLAAIIYLFIKHRDKFREAKKRIFSTGFFVSIIAYFFFLITQFKTVFISWDDFSHWGPMVKEMLRLDKFYSVPEAMVPQHKDYPPIVSLFELFFVKFAHYKEGILVIAAHFIKLSFFLPIIETIKKPRPLIKALLILALAWLGVSFIDQHGIIDTAYVDYIMAIAVAFGLYLAIFGERNRFNLLYLISVIIYLSLLKEICVVFAGIIALTYFIRRIVENGRKGWLKYLVLPASICVIAIAGFMSWKIITKDTETDRQFDLSQVSQKSLICPFFHNCPEKYRNETAENFTRAIFTDNISNSTIPLSYVQELALVGLLFFLVYLKTDRKAEAKKTAKLLFASYFIGAIIYTVLMFITFTSMFYEWEAPQLNSFNRYMGTYILVGITLALFYYVHTNITLKLNQLYVILAIAILLQSQTGLGKLLPQHTYYNESDYANSMKAAIKEDENVVVAYHHLFHYNFFRYYSLTSINQTRPVDISEDIDEAYAQLKDEQSRIIFIDLTTDDCAKLTELTGQTITNGQLYNLSK